MLNGQKMYVDEKDIGDDDDATTTGDESGEGASDAAPAPAAGDIDSETKAAAAAIGSQLRKELGLDVISEQLKDLTEKHIDQPENSKLKEILNGKDLVKDKASLTAEEKIIGFYHGLVTDDKEVLKALSEGVNADGGYLFPAEFSSELIKPLSEPTRMRSLVRVITMKRKTFTAPSLANRPKMYWTGENAAKTTTTANFGQVSLTARKAAAIIYSSDELLEDSDSIDIVRLIIDLFAESIGEAEDYVILRGDGTTQPRGIETARAAGDIASVAFGGTTTFDKLKDLKYALKAKYRRGATWLIHPDKVADIDKLKDNDGRYIWQESVLPDKPNTLLGLPVSEQYDLPENTLFLGNWKLVYWLGDRKQMTVKVSNDTETAFTKDQTAIRVVIRLAGDVVLGEAAKATATA